MKFKLFFFQVIFITETMTLQLIQKYKDLDPVIQHFKSWHKIKSKLVKTDITILGNKTLLRFL